MLLSCSSIIQDKFGSLEIFLVIKNIDDADVETKYAPRIALIKATLFVHKVQPAS